MLSEDNLAWHTTNYQGADSWRDFVQEYLDSLVSCDLFEHMEEYKYEDANTERSVATAGVPARNSQKNPVDKAAHPSPPRRGRRSHNKQPTEYKILPRPPTDTPLVQPPPFQPSWIDKTSASAKQPAQIKPVEKAKLKGNPQPNLTGQKDIRSKAPPANMGPNSGKPDTSDSKPTPGKHRNNNRKNNNGTSNGNGNKVDGNNGTDKKPGRNRHHIKIRMPPEQIQGHI